MLEVARTLVADRSIKLVAPIVFLFDGGEETFSQVCSRICLLMHHPLVHLQMPISTVSGRVLTLAALARAKASSRA